ncbi:MAG: proton-conducting transporter membrane subunit [Candidatus Cloacimonetes bacterium]|jgi:formate hydrogenlyase subunit 3/multisubunit Na+/H+ antiporter MnhD subunit|nr:proton-conducting transporter membrane subunit [Candidatus Cloacimonadota bacterium]MDD4277221.1 proton-conducting transporter membrane subunit [Candidatus Cloacimonadota bacterium]MDY0325761.1 proton-conducting transporter membrane subunit [Candidatus Cloacimonadaceae bacterium]
MSIGIIILLVALIPALWKRSDFFVVLWILGSAFLAYEYMEVLYSRSVQDFILVMPPPVGSISIALNKLSAFFGVIFSLGLPIGMFYGHFYLKEHPSKALRSHLFWLGVMGLTMHGLLWVRHSLIFLMIWELMSLSSFFCVLFSKRENLEAGLNYLITMQVGAAFLIAGFALAYIQSGTFDFSGFEKMNSLPMYLILIGFAFKAGIFPFASWLPQAHPVAPSHVSGIMSSMLVKTGFYGMLLIVCTNHFSLMEIGILCLVFSISAFWAVCHLLNERNLKRVLAYSTVENVGIAGLGVCAGLLGLHANLPNMAMLGFTGAFLHIFFHSIFKAQLFYSSGNILLATGTLDIDEMGALAKRMPHTAVLTLIGIMAICALPLTSGFISEFTIFKAMFEVPGAVHLSHILPGLLILGALAFIGALAIIAFIRIYAIVFLGSPRTPAAENARELGRGIRLPIAVLSLAILITGIFPNVALRFVKPLIRWFGLDMRYFAEFQALMLQITYVYLILIALFALLYVIRKLLVKEKLGATWACAYPKVSPRMQSSSMTYVQPLAYFLKPFMYKKTRHLKEEGDFTTKVEYDEEHLDAVWDIIVRPVSRGISKFLLLFSGLHNGKTNSYIAWGLTFLVIVLVWVVGFR